MKIKRITGMLLVIMLFCNISAFAKTVELMIGSENMYVSDDKIDALTVDAPPYIENSRTMVPVRVVSESFGADVDWNEAERKVTIKLDETTVVLTIDSTAATVGSEEKTLDTPAVIKDGRTMVPLRFVSEALGKNVEYVDASKQILITDQNPVMTIDNSFVSLEDLDVALKYITYSQEENAEESVLNALDYFVSFVPVANAAKENGFSLNESQKKELTDSVMNDKEEYYSLFLTAPLIKVLSDNLLAKSYMDSLVSEYEISDDYLNQIYSDTYVRAKHILILTEDPQTGEALSEKEKAQAKKEIEDIAKKIKNGDDFDALMNEYGQDPGIEYYPDGYVFTYGEMVKEFEDAAFALKDGEISDIVESDFGYHIIKKEPLPQLDEYTKLIIKNNFVTDLTNRIFQGIAEKASIKLVTPVEELMKIFS